MKRLFLCQYLLLSQDFEDNIKMKTNHILVSVGKCSTVKNIDLQVCVPFTVIQDTHCAAVQSRPFPVSSQCKQSPHPSDKNIHIMEHVTRKHGINLYTCYVPLSFVLLMKVSQMCWPSITCTVHLHVVFKPVSEVTFPYQLTGSDAFK